MQVIKKVLNRLVEDDIRKRIHDKMQVIAHRALANDAHELLVSLGKKTGDLPYPDFDHKSFYATHADLKARGDYEGMERYIDGLRSNLHINESQDEDDPPKKDNVIDLSMERFKRTPLPQPPSPNDHAFNDYMNNLDSLRRRVMKPSEPKKTSEVKFQERVHANMVNTSDDLFKQLHTYARQQSYPDHIADTLTEHFEDHGKFKEPHTAHAFLARSQATLAAHDPYYTATDLSKTITKHLGAVLEHSYYDEEQKKNIRFATELGHVEGLHGSASYRLGRSKDLDDY